MLRTATRRALRPYRRTPTVQPATARSVNMAAMAASASAPAPVPPQAPAPRQEGDISNAFASLSGLKDQTLPDDFRLLKLHLTRGREEAIKASWNRLLDELQAENDLVAHQGPAVIPEVRFSHLATDLPAALPEIKKRGTVVIRGVIPEDEARAYKFELEDYIRKNHPRTKGFPPNDPQVWELYWSAPQLRARTHPNFLDVQTALMQATWTVSNPESLISLAQPLTYADRLRIRQPGDAAFALGPHQDGGSVERWMVEGYGRGGTYDAIFEGKWDTQYDPWDASTRVDSVNDLYGGLGACSMFRMFQGWLSMSEVGPREGTLLVNPLLKLATAYSLLRPFFRPRRGAAGLDDTMPSAGSQERKQFLAKENWEFTAGEAMTSELPGATPGYGMEFPNVAMHPHLELDRTMVHVPRVKPGDYVAWHCDTIHAVDFEHNGTGDSSALYIPICPITEINADYVGRMRAAWRIGTPGPDFPGGKGESQHVDRPTEAFLRAATNDMGLASVGLAPLTSGVHLAADGNKGRVGEREVIARVNHLLGV